MKHSLFLCVVLIAALGPAVEAFFLGPIAVGVGLGALAVTKGLILGSILGRSRTSSRGGRSYTRYSRTNHYHQTNNYYTHYTQPRTVSVVFFAKGKYCTHSCFSIIIPQKATATEARGRSLTTARRS